MNNGKEADVVADFAAWLAEGGWQVDTEPGWADVVAVRGAEHLVGEAKGVTSSPGLDVDTLYGQLLRRMTVPDSTIRYAVIVPPRALNAALRVPQPVREHLRIEVYTVDEHGTVTRH